MVKTAGTVALPLYADRTSGAPTAGPYFTFFFFFVFVFFFFVLVLYLLWFVVLRTCI
jgi:hypothetical protein